MGSGRRLAIAGLMAAALWGTGVAAADLDEVLRPLPDKGQAVLDFDASYTKEWQHWRSVSLWQFGSQPPQRFVYDSYLHEHYFKPSASLRVGITPTLALTASGDFTQHTTPYSNANQDRDWNGSAGFVLRPTSGFQIGGSFSRYSSAQWSGSPSYDAYYSYSHTLQTFLLTADWMSDPKPSYTNLVPDLNGLLGPLMDPGQDWISARVWMDREWSTNQSGLYSFGRGDSDDRWTISAAWAHGLAKAWELEMRGTYTPAYDVNSRSRYQSWPYGTVTTQGGTGKYGDQWQAGARLRYRWSPTAEATLSLSREYSALDVTMTPPVPNFPDYHEDWRAWSASAGWTLLSRPTRAGAPLGHDLNGLYGPILDPGQWLWDGTFAWSRTAVSYRPVTQPPPAYNMVYPPSWGLRTGVSYGLTTALQLRGDLRLNPQFPGGDAPDEWQHGALGASLVYQSSPHLRARASYNYALDASGGGRWTSWYRNETQFFSAGFSIAW